MAKTPPVKKRPKLSKIIRRALKEDSFTKTGIGLSTVIARRLLSKIKNLPPEKRKKILELEKRKNLSAHLRVDNQFKTPLGAKKMLLLTESALKETPDFAREIGFSPVSKLTEKIGAIERNIKTAIRLKNKFSKEPGKSNIVVDPKTGSILAFGEHKGKVFVMPEQVLATEFLIFASENLFSQRINSLLGEKESKRYGTAKKRLTHFISSDAEKELVKDMLHNPSSKKIH